MKIKIVPVSITTVFLLLFAGNAAYSGEPTWDSNSDEVTPWESFRGWSPRVSYGQPSTENPVAHEEKSSGRESNGSPMDKAAPENAKNENSPSAVQDDVKPWESFRGWSRPVPYNRNY